MKWSGRDVREGCERDEDGDSRSLDILRAAEHTRDEEATTMHFPKNRPYLHGDKVVIIRDH